MCSPGRITDGPPLTLTLVLDPAFPVSRPLAGLLAPLLLACHRRNLRLTLMQFL
jgi:hypothetical protein